MTDEPFRNMPDEVELYHNPNPPKRKVSKLSHSTVRHSDVLLSFDSPSRQLAYNDICQLNLFTLILYRAKNSGYANFGLATEAPDVQKFDDIFFVGKKDEREIVRYIQAKYSESDAGGEIRMSDLKSKYLKNDFSILRYFKAYLEIKKRCSNFGSDLFNFEIDDVTVVTNKGFATDILEHFHDGAIHTLAEDNFLYAGNQLKSQKYTVKQGKLYDDLSKVFMEETKAAQTEIDKFFKKFHLVVDYPSGLEMERMLEAELREIYNILEGSAKLSLLRVELYDWLMKRTAGADFHTYQLASELFARIGSKILDYEMYSISKSNLEDISNEYKFQNNQLLERLEEFLASDTVFVLALQFNTIRLARMRVMQAFEQLRNESRYYEQLKAYTHQFGHIFINTTQLLNRNFLKSLKQHLQDELKCRLIVVELDDMRDSSYNSIISHLRNLRRKVLLISKNKRHNSLPLEVQETLQVETNFSDLEPNSQEKFLKTEHALFQDTSVYINIMIGDQNKNLIDAIVLDDFIFGRNVKIGKPFPRKAYIEFSYIKRRLHFNISIRTSITKKLMRASFAENAFYLPNGRSFVCANDVIVISRSKEDFENTGENFKSKNCHWLKYVGDKLFWMQSKGSISELASYRELDAIVEDERQQIDEEALVEGREKIVIISGGFGTGKSTLFGSLARQIKITEDLCWTIRTDLIDYSSFLSKKAKDWTTHPVSSTENDNTAIDLLIELLGSNEPLSILEERLLRASLQRQENNPDSEKRLKVALFIDQFSEMDHDFRNFVLDMLVGLNSTDMFKMFVSTRPATRSILEVALGSFAHEIEPFSKADQLEFFEKHTLDNEVLNTLDNRHDFYGTPLCLEIITKIDADRLKALDKNCVFDIFEITQTSRNDFQEVYEQVFRKYFSDSTPPERNFDLNNVKSELSSILIPGNHTNAEFVSRYADYSVVKFLAYCLLHREPNEMFYDILIEEFLQRKEHSFIRTLLDNWWAKYGGQISSDSIEKLGAHFSSVNEQLRRNVFGKILKENCREIFKVLLKASLNLELPTLELTVGIIKMLLDLNPNSDANDLLLKAVKSSNSNVCEWILNSQTVNINGDQLFEIFENVAKFDRQENFKWLLYRGLTGDTFSIDGSSLLHVAAGCAARNFFCWLVRGNNIKNLINVQNYNGHTPLHVAIASKNLPAVRVLIENGANVKLTDEMGITLLHYAAMHGNEETCLQLLRHFEDINVKTKEGKTPLHVAIHANNLMNVKALVQNGADVKSVDVNGYSILHFASCVGDREMLSYILNYVDDINSKTKQNQTPLHVAVSYNNSEAFKILIENNADINFRDGDGYSILDVVILAENLEMCSYLLKYVNIDSRSSDGNTPLLFAALKNKFESIKFLIDNGADMKVVNNDGWTILHVTAKNGSRDSSLYILDNYKEIDVMEKNGTTPLHVAIANSNVDTMKALIENKADAHLRDENGWNIWHFAERAGNIEICSYLLNCNREINAKNSDGKTPLLEAAMNNKFEILKFLIENGADIKAVDIRGWTISHYIAKHGNRNTCSYVLDNYIDIDAKEKDGATPLHVAISNSNIDTMKVLIEKKADVNLTDCKAWTVWHYAARAGNREICSYLLNYNSDINAQNGNGDTPLLVAAMENKIESLKYLIEKGADVKRANNNGFTVLHKIAQHGRRDICFYVLDYFRDINAKTKQGETPLRLSIYSNNFETSKVLIKSHADLNLRDTGGCTVWHWAAHVGNTKICSYLLNYNREINAKNNKGKTPLHVAVCNNKLESLKFLIENGADANAADYNGYSPLYIAVGANNIKAVLAFSGRE